MLTGQAPLPGGNPSSRDSGQSGAEGDGGTGGGGGGGGDLVPREAWVRPGEDLTLILSSSPFKTSLKNNEIFHDYSSK